MRFIVEPKTFFPQKIFAKEINIRIQERNQKNVLVPFLQRTLRLDKKIFNI